MLRSPDFKELLSILAKHEVRYLADSKLASGREQDLRDVESIKRNLGVVTK